MLDFLLSNNNYWFSLALAIMTGLLVLELLTMLIGANISELLDNFLPNVDVNVESPNISVKLFSWFYLDKVPALVALIIFLMCFGLTGLLLQTVLIEAVGIILNIWFVTPLVLIISLLMSRKLILLFGFLVPLDESTAISTDSLVGKVAIITQGVARAGLPAEAKVTDEHGQIHYVRVEPDRIGEELPKGMQVILFEKKKGSSVFLVSEFK